MNKRLAIKNLFIIVPHIRFSHDDLNKKHIFSDFPI